MDMECLADVAALEQTGRRFETTFDGGTVIWRRWGQGVPAVLLHGGSGSWNHWVRSIPALVAAGREVWAPDMPGCGESSAPLVGEDADVLPAPLEQGLQQLLGDVTVDLVGFSFGGLVAGFMAERWPQRVRRLVLVGAAGLGLNPLQPILLRSWMHQRDEARRQRIHRANLAALMLHAPESIDDLAVALHAFNLPRDRLLRRRLSQTDALRRSLERVTCPVCGIYGDQDVLFSGQHGALAEALMAAPACAGLEIVPEAGHWVQYERPAAFDAALARALGVVAPPAV